MNGNEQRGLRTEKEKIGARSSVLGPPSFEMHIEELVLHGFAPGDRYRIGEAVERELARLFSEQGAAMNFGEDLEMARLDGGTFEMKAGARPDVIGVQIAQAIYSGLNR